MGVISPRALVQFVLTPAKHIDLPRDPNVAERIRSPRHCWHERERIRETDGQKGCEDERPEQASDLPRLASPGSGRRVAAILGLGETVQEEAEEELACSAISSGQTRETIDIS